MEGDVSVEVVGVEEEHARQKPNHAQDYHQGDRAERRAVGEVVNAEQEARDDRRQDYGRPSAAILQQSLRHAPYHGPTHQNLRYRGHEHLSVGIDENYRVPSRSALQGVESQAERHANNNSDSRVPESSEPSLLTRHGAPSRQEADHKSRSTNPYHDVGHERVEESCAHRFRV